MATRIQVRRDSAADWSAENPVLRAGEWGFETDTGRIKIGNGSGAWDDLAYVMVGQNQTAEPDNYAVAHYRDDTKRWHATAVTITTDGVIGADALGVGSVAIESGTGSPEGVVTAPRGSLYLRDNGTATTILYVKTTGGLPDTNTGWKAVGGGEGGGASELDDLTDVDAASPTAYQLLGFNGAEWQPMSVGLPVIPAGSVINVKEVAGAYTRPTARTDVCCVFTGTADPGSEAIDGDKWDRL